MRKKIVVLLSTFNGEKFIFSQLESIYKQNTDCDIEILVRDDGSTDNTQDILKSWEDKLKISYLIDSYNLGAAHSFWRLLSCAPIADYYAFVDQDDIWDCNKISTAISSIDEYKCSVLWCSNCRLIDEYGNVIQDKMHYNPPKLDIISQLICGSFQGCSMVFNREAYKFIMQCRIPNIRMHDIVIMTHIIAINKVVYDETPLFSYRIHSNNVVAKRGKSFVKRTLSSLNNWFGKSHKYATSLLAAELLYNVGVNLSVETYQYLKWVAECKKNIVYRLKIVMDKRTKNDNRKGLRTFKIKVILGII